MTFSSPSSVAPHPGTRQPYSSTFQQPALAGGAFDGVAHFALADEAARRSPYYRSLRMWGPSPTICWCTISKSKTPSGDIFTSTPLKPVFRGAGNQRLTDGSVTAAVLDFAECGGYNKKRTARSSPAPHSSCPAGAERRRSCASAVAETRPAGTSTPGTSKLTRNCRQW